MRISFLEVHRCLYLVTVNTQFDIEKRQFQFADGRCELESWVEIRDIIDVLLQIVASALRAFNNVINVTFVQLWDEARLSLIFFEALLKLRA